MILNGPACSQLEEDLARVKEILSMTFESLSDPEEHNLRNRQSSLLPVPWVHHQVADSVGRLLHREYNNWLKSIPQHVKELLLIVKREYQPEWVMIGKKGSV